MPESALCPEAQNVHLLLLGRLTPQEVARIRAHVGQCHLCSALLTSLQEGETLVYGPEGPPLASATPAPDATVNLPGEGTVRRNDDDTMNLPVRPAEDETLNLPGQPAVKRAPDETLHLPPPADPTEAETLVCPPGPDPAPPRRATPQPSIIPNLPREKLIADVYARLTPPQAADEIGRLGPYRVLGVLGAGSVGAVFEAEDPRHKRRVALKVLHPVLATELRARQHFLSALREVGTVQHEHLAALHEVGEQTGALFVAMQLLKGETLDERLRREGALSAAEVLRVGHELAAGLAAAHARNLCHGDLGLADVWLEVGLGGRAAAGQLARGTVKLLDLGLKQALRGEAHAGRDQGISADLFALGILLYRMGTGCAPFPADTPLPESPPNPCQRNRTLPPELGQLVVRLLTPTGSGPALTAREVAETLGALAWGTAAGETREWKVAPSRPADCGIKDRSSIRNPQSAVETAAGGCCWAPGCCASRALPWAAISGCARVTTTRLRSTLIQNRRPTRCRRMARQVS